MPAANPIALVASLHAVSPATTAAAPVQSWETNANSGNNTGADFSQMLVDSQASTTLATAGASPNVTPAEPTSDTAAQALAALIAQQLGSAAPTQNTKATTTAATLNSLTATLKNNGTATQTVSPEVASAALDLLNQQPANDNVTNTLKDIFAQIKATGTPQTVGAIVGKLMEAYPSASPSVSGQIVQQALMNLTTGLTQQGTKNISTLTTDTASSNTGNTDTTQDADAGNNPTDPSLMVVTEGLLASLFRSAGELTTTQQTPVATASSNQASAAGNLRVSIEPLSQQTTQRMAADDAIDAQDTPPLNTLIPSLATGAQSANTSQDLPDVSLPHVAFGAVKTTQAASQPMDEKALANLASTSSLSNGTAASTAAPAQVTDKDSDKKQVPSAPASQLNIPVTPQAATIANTQAASSQTASAPRAVSSVNSSDSKPAVTAPDAEKSAATDGTAKPAANDKSAINAFPMLLTQEMHSTTKTTAVTTAAPVPVTEQVHIAVSRAAKDGINDMTIQLDPLDLGRVEVKMHTGSDGQTQISFIVDKPSTLDSLSRTAHQLERSLQESGVKTDSGNMQFNLRQQPQTMDTGTGSSNRNPHQANQPQAQADSKTDTAALDPVIAAAATRNYSLSLSGNLDIHA